MEHQGPDLVPSVVDHVGFTVADYEQSKAFYEQALAPLGVTLLMEFAGAAAGFGKSGRPSFFLEAHGEPVRGRLHIALRAETRAQVDAFHEAALRGRRNRQRGTRRASGLSPGLLRCVRPRPRRKQHRGCLPRARLERGLTASAELLPEIAPLPAAGARTAGDRG